MYFFYEKRTERVDKLGFIGEFKINSVVGATGVAVGSWSPAVSNRTKKCMRVDEIICKQIAPSPTVLNACQSVTVEGF